MSFRRPLLLVLALALWTSPSVAARKSLHTRFYFSLVGGKGYWTETASAPSPLGSVGGWSCTAEPIDLMQTGSGAVYRTAHISCVDTNGAEAMIGAQCKIAEEDRDDGDVMLRMKSAETVHVSMSCYTRRE